MSGRRGTAMTMLRAVPAVGAFPAGSDAQSEGALIEATGVRVRRGGREILCGVDLVVHAGEVVVLVGPNGAGKSTLLAAISGDEDVDGGQVLLDGRPAHRWRPREAALRRAVLPQSNPLSFPFRVREVVEMGRAPWRGRATAAQDAAAVRRATDCTAVTDLADRTYPSLSGGEAARVSLARVLAQESPLLLLDEPTAALDAHHQEAVFEVLRERTRAGAGVLAVVHDLNLTAAYADRVVVLTDGRIEADGSPAAVLRDDVLSAAYRHPMEVVAHPGSGLPTVMPRRRSADPVLVPGAVRAGDR